MKKEADGLSTPRELTALGDQLTAFADALHARILKEMGAREGRISQSRQDMLRRLFDEELLLRQRANSLYADAATLIVTSLGQSQRQVAALTLAAAEKIRKIAALKDTLGLVAGVLALAGAATTGQAGPILLALEKIRHQLNALDAHTAAHKPA